MNRYSQAAKQWPVGSAAAARTMLLKLVNSTGYDISSITYQKLVTNQMQAKDLQEPRRVGMSRTAGSAIPPVKSEFQLDGEAIPFLQSPNRSKDTDGKPPIYLVLHSTGGKFSGDLNWMRNPNASRRVSAHFLVGRDGRIVQLVGLDEKAWHAGKSEYQGNRDLNRMSLGIEMEHEDGKQDWPNAQMHAVAKLVTELQSQFGIPIENIVGHADIAIPRRRKVDPMNFPWERFRTMIGQAPESSTGPHVTTEGFRPGMRVRLPDGSIGAVASTANDTLMVRDDRGAVYPVSPLTVQPY